MEQNSLIEIGSKANVIISFNTQRTINGKVYAANEPYLFLQNVTINLTYKNIEKTNSAGQNRIANSAIYPDLLILREVPLSRKLIALLLTYIDTNQTYSQHNFMTLTAEDGIIYMPDTIVNSDFKVYDSNFDEVAASYVEASNTLTSLSFVADQQYLVFFASELIGTRFNFVQSCNSYMNIEIQSIGNIDKVSKKAVIFIDKASLNSVIDFNFIYNSGISIPLSFNIIDNSGYIVFED